jgi:hypothetical protein
MAAETMAFADTYDAAYSLKNDLGIILGKNIPLLILTVMQFNATCFSLFPDAGMADLLGALDSRNGGERKCISR